jgi:hypothetical protein
MGNPFQAGLRQKYWGAYVQDDVRLAKGLNLHVGVRWEPSLPEHDILARGSHFSMPAFLAGQKSSVYPNAPAGLLFHGDPNTPESYANPNWAGFAPRVGLAWDPSGRGAQSLRASYGIFFDTPETFTARDFGASAPWGNTIALTAPAGGLSNPFLGYPGGQPISVALPAQPERRIPRRWAVHHVPAEPAPHVSPTVGPELSASIYGELAGYCRLSGEQGDSLASVGGSQSRGVHFRIFHNRQYPATAAAHAVESGAGTILFECHPGG